MRTLIPVKFCQSESYFRQCFNITESKCIEIANLSTKACMNKININLPDMLNQPDDGTKWGGIVGNCAEQVYEKSLSALKIDNSYCTKLSENTKT